MSNIGHDAYINGDVSANVGIDIADDLHVPESAGVDDDVHYRNLIREAVHVQEPCDCDSEDLIPIADIVAMRANHNDNALIGLDAAALNRPLRPARLELPCGRYYLDKIDSPAGAVVAAHGHVALYVGGEVNSNVALAREARLLPQKNINN